MRVDLPSLARRHGRRVVFAVYGMISCAVSVGVIASVAAITGQPLVLPSLGPTAYLIFDRPRQGAATPRNIIFGHATGAAAGSAALVLFGLLHATPALTGGITAGRVGAIALALGATAGVMTVGRFVHPPATATALIVALGVLHVPEGVVALMVGVALLAAQGALIDRTVGLDYPVWAEDPVGQP